MNEHFVPSDKTLIEAYSQEIVPGHPSMTLKELIDSHRSLRETNRVYLHKYPTYLVEITYTQHDNEFIITANGNDDYSLAKRTTDEAAALTNLMAILRMPYVNQDNLINMGFTFNN